MKRIIVLGSGDREALAFARSLGRAGIELHFVTSNDSSIVGWSRFAKRVSNFGLAAGAIGPFVDALLAELQRTAYDLLIPLTSVACRICAAARTRIETHCPVALPSNEALRFATDKAALLELCDLLRIATPPRLVVQRLEQLAPLLRRLDQYPYNLSALYDTAIKGGRVEQYTAQRATAARQVERFVRAHVRSVPVMIQQVPPGFQMSVPFLARAGEVLSMAQQRHLRDFADGDASYCAIGPVDSAIGSAIGRLVSTIGWHGAGVFRLRYDPATTAWAIIQLCEHPAGAAALTRVYGRGYANWFAQLYSGQSRVVARPSRPRSRTLQRQRHLGEDLQWLSRQLARPDRTTTVLHWLADCRHLLRRGERLELERLDDPLPAVVYWLRALARPARTHLQSHRQRRLVGRPRQTRRQIEQLLRTLERRQLRLLFVGRGNVCRSAFAEKYLQQRKDYLAVRSAGTFEQTGRMVPALAEHSARLFSVDLSQHGSEVLNCATIAWADAVIVMDNETYAAVRAHPEMDRPLVVLPAVVGAREVLDPADSDRQQDFEDCFRRIAEYLDRLLPHGGNPANAAALVRTSGVAAQPQVARGHCR